MLTAIFFLAQSQDANGNNKKQSAIPEGAFMVILIVIVIGFHYFLNDSFRELETALPLTLAVDGTSAAQIEHGQDRTSGETAFNEKRAHGQGSSSVEAAPAIQAGANGKGYEADVTPGEKKQEPISDEHDSAFYHPSLTGEQKPIWLPNDKFGIGRAAVASARKAGLDATYKHTSVTEKGQVETDAYEPPGEPLV